MDNGFRCDVRPTLKLSFKHDGLLNACVSFAFQPGLKHPYLFVVPIPGGPVELTLGAVAEMEVVLTPVIVNVIGEGVAPDKIVTGDPPLGSAFPA
jgi:hypothetical protein